MLMVLIYFVLLWLSHQLLIPVHIHQSCSTDTDVNQTQQHVTKHILCAYLLGCRYHHNIGIHLQKIHLIIAQHLHLLYWSNFTRAFTGLKSPTIQLCVEHMVQANGKENIKSSSYWPFFRVIPRWTGFPSQKVNDAGSVSIPWRHHGWRKLYSW